ncbi:MAG TPA: hypothetical protein VFC99_00830 [Acidimicrobiia bacterium]|nr:hypothetical protein [Acidimicrobiia bacterium]
MSPRILSPVAPPPGLTTSPTYDLGRPVAGVNVGLRIDHSWRSYMVVVDEWERMFRADGATPNVLWTGERVGGDGERTRADLDEWSRLVECGVVGLGN